MSPSSPSLHVRTPLLESRILSRRLERRVLLKMEAFQPVGSFKIRGLGLLCQKSAQSGARLLVCASGGNAGLAVAYAARRLGLPAHVVVPETTPPLARDRILSEGATVEEHGAVWDDAQTRATVVARQRKGVVIHPFDDPVIWSGHATLVREIVEDGERPHAVVVSVGGGGLLCGVLEGLHLAGLSGTAVHAVETVGAASLHAARDHGQVVELPAITSLATTLGARSVCQKAFEWIEAHPLTLRSVSDRQAVAACGRFLDEHRVLVEPACGAALAALETAPETFGKGDTIVVIVCGGAGVSRQLLQEWERRTASTPSAGPSSGTSR